MNNEEYKPISNYLALTIKRDNKLTVKKFTKKMARMSIKIILYLTILTFANIFV